jgi:O-antigen ligase
MVQDRAALRGRLRAAAAVLAAGLVVGVAVVHGDTKLVVAVPLGLAAFAAVLLRTEAVLLVWFTMILVDGRWFTYHKLGPLYITEPFLALVTFGLVVRVSLGAIELRSRREALRYLALLLAIMFVPALAGLALRTPTYDLATARNFLLILYAVFGVIAAAVIRLEQTYRRWFVVALVAPAIALLIAVTGHAGHEAATSTGSIRLAAFTFPLAFGIAPIVLVAAAREGLIRTLHALIGSAPFLVGLVFVNHRSAWVAFIAGAGLLFVKRLSPAVVFGSVAVLAVGVLLLSYSAARTSTLGEEIARAKSVTSTTDPNTRYRLQFWEKALSRSIASPVIGNGFDLYPADIVPPGTSFDPFPAPHNSFIAIAYRIGFIPFLLFVAVLGRLLVRGYRASVDRTKPVERAVYSALTAIVVYTGLTSAFNVFLEAPYAGPLFWTAVGMLAYTVYARPFDRPALGRAPGST